MLECKPLSKGYLTGFPVVRLDGPNLDWFFRTPAFVAPTNNHPPLLRIRTECIQGWVVGLLPLGHLIRRQGYIKVLGVRAEYERRGGVWCLQSGAAWRARDLQSAGQRNAPRNSALTACIFSRKKWPVDIIYLFTVCCLGTVCARHVRSLRVRASPPSSRA